jgi:tRNA modification GTPase
VALALRGALDQLGEMVGAVYTNDLLDRIFSRFCIGK